MTCWYLYTFWPMLDLNFVSIDGCSLRLVFPCIQLWTNGEDIPDVEGELRMSITDPEYLFEL